MTTLPIFATLEPLEKVSTFTPFGIRFWDISEDMAVEAGLEVTARPPGQRHLTRRAIRTASGVYAFHQLPGLRAVEVSDPALDAGVHPSMSPPVSVRYVIEVHDLLNRFLPVTFQVDLPYLGIYPAQSSAGSHLPGFYLFSAPTRSALSGMAVIRAQLVQQENTIGSRPASHAVLEVETNAGIRWRGISDDKGSVAVYFPYPPFTAAVGQASPPTLSPEQHQTWDLSVRVQYQPDAQRRPDQIARLPDLHSVLTQPAAAFRLSPFGLPQDHFIAQLVFGQPLVLKTANSSELWIEI